ncbi:MAG: hypothetical protein Q8877_02735 [Sweet potato little leaf phytoplasma]|nr:hypothetical protein [Sweet potato little leaf phytoplasma]
MIEIEYQQNHQNQLFPIYITVYKFFTSYNLEFLNYFEYNLNILSFVEVSTTRFF